MEKNDVKEFNNIKDLIKNSAEIYSNNIAFTLKEKEGNNTFYRNITYTKLLEDINCFGTKLFNMGYKDKRIAIIGRNKYEWAIAHLANLLGGIVSVPIDKELQIDEMENSLIRSKADAVVFDIKNIEQIKEIKKRNNTNLKEYICMEAELGFLDVNMLMYEGKKLLKSGNNEYLEAKVDGNKMSILLFTSGTTSKSKAVMLSQKGITSNIYAMQLVEPIYSTDTNIAFLPFHHIFGSTGLLVMLANGVRTVFTDGLRYIKQNLAEYEVSLFVCVPILIEALYKGILKEVEKQKKTKLIKFALAISNFLLKFKIDIRRKIFKQIIDQLGGSMRFVISGGAPLDKEVKIGLENFGIKVAQGYGLTETSPVIAAENKKESRVGSVGTAMSNMMVEVVNKDDSGIGELRVKGPSVMIGYYENEEATNDVLKNGWFYTGDLGYIDKDGFVFITGRQKDMIVLKNGKKVFPEELESLINKLDIVKESFVYGMPALADNDVTVSVKVVYDEDVKNAKYRQLNDDELKNVIWEQIKEINKTLPRYKYIKHLSITDKELIKTTTRKIKRNEEIKTII